MDTSGNYIRNQFCNYEIALKLKELGFNKECFSAYILDFDTNLPVLHIYQEEEEEYWKIEDIGFICDAPLWQQALDYLREKFLVHVNITMVVTTYGIYESAGQEVLWRYGRYMANTKNDVRNKDDLARYKTYHEALEAGILDAIELIKNNNEKPDTKKAGND